MAPPKKVDVLQRYQTELERAIKWRNDEDLDGLWRRMIDLYKGKHYANDGQGDRLVVNRAFSIKNVIAPSVAVNNPKFVVNARKPEEAPQALITEEVLNYLWRAHKYKKEFRLAVDDFLVVGHGWCKVGYKFKKETVELKTLPNDGGEDPISQAEHGVDDREPIEGNVESEQRIIDDRPFVERLSVFDVYVDPDARNLGEARWIAQRVKRNVADVKVDSRYKTTHRNEAAKMEQHDRWSSTDDDIRGDLSANTASRGFVDVWEFYDLRENKVCTFTRKYTKGFLIDPTDTPYSFGHPFVMLRNYEVPDQLYPMGELEAVEILQLELNTTRTEMMLHRRQNARKYLYDEQMFTADGALDALRSDIDNTMVPVDTSTGDMANAIRPMPTNPIAADQYNMSEVIESDMSEIVGLNDYMSGASANIRRTATEAAMIQDQQNARASDKLAGIEECLALIGERLIQLLQQYMTEEQVIRIVGSTAMPTWVKYDKDYIAGSFDYEVEGGSTQPNNESFRAQRAMQMMDAMTPFIGLGVVDLPALLRKVLQDGFGEKDPSRFIMEQEEGAPPMGAEPPMPGGGGPPMAGPPPAPEMGAEGSAIAGIPPELLARLDVEPSPVMALQ